MILGYRKMVNQGLEGAIHELKVKYNKKYSFFLLFSKMLVLYLQKLKVSSSESQVIIAYSSKKSIQI